MSGKHRRGETVVESTYPGKDRRGKELVRKNRQGKDLHGKRPCTLLVRANFSWGTNFHRGQILSRGAIALDGFVTGGL